MGPIDWTRRVANPDALGEAEKDLWVQIEPVLSEVLDELKKRGKIETVFSPAEIDALWSCIRKQDDFSLVHNFLIHLFDSPEKSSAFLESNAKFGFDEPKIISTYILAAVTLTVLQTELFKLIVLFHTKNMDRRVSRFVSSMRSAAPDSWPRLEPFVDNPLRNALAHGTYAIINRKIALFKDANLEPLEQLELAAFMMRIKTRSVLLQCLINTVASKVEQGFFTP